MGLNLNRDRLCLIQISSGNGDAYLVQFKDQTSYDHAVNLKKLLDDQSKCIIFHYARFDLAAIRKFLKIKITNIFCTKIASKICRTYTDSHGLKDLCRELLSVQISKQQQSSDWGNEKLSKDQLEYAANDVLYLHDLREKLTLMLMRDDKMNIAKACFNFIPHKVEMDLMGYEELDIFAH